MGKKKKHQEPPCLFMDKDTSDEEHVKKIDKYCPHVLKAVNNGAVKKAIKNQDLVKCQLCCDSKSASSKEDDETVKDTAIWLCLQCGYQACKGDNSAGHAFLHYKTPHSDCHAVIVNVSSWSVWCYECAMEVPLELSRHKHLCECVNFVKKQLGQHHNKRILNAFSENKDKINLEDLCPTPSASQIKENSSYHVDTTNDTQKVQGKINESAKEVKKGIKEIKKNTLKDVKKSSMRSTSPVEAIKSRVKGLVNLGNTCFFNAVMQNLSQTSCLLELLEERCKKGYIWHVGKPLLLASKVFGDLNAEENALKLEAFDAILQDCGALTQGLLTFLKQMNFHSSVSKSEVVNPGQLFGLICKKMPQFRGFQQQDSHEVLRYLLDGIRSEEIKRQQASILKVFNLTVKVNPNSVDEETKNIIKAYRRQASHTFIDSIFGGQLLSTIQCEECHKTSQVLEPFMDLSLPVAEEKPGRPGTQKHAVQEDLKVSNGDKYIKDDKEISKPNVYQERKMKRQAKKEAKKQAKANRVDTTHSNSLDFSLSKGKSVLDQDGTTEEFSSADIAEADVEDNVDSESTSSKNACSSLPDGDLEYCNSIQGFSNSYGISEGVLRNGSIVAPSNEIEMTEDETVCIDVKKTDIDVEGESKNEHFPFVEEGGSFNNTNPHNYSVSIDCNDMIKQEVREDCDFRIKRQDGGGDLQKSFHLAQEWVTRSLTTLASQPSSLPHSCSIVSCLNQFTMPELLTGNNKFGCENCAHLKRKNMDEAVNELVYTSARKQLLIFSPPAVLTLHLKRFQQVGLNLRKVNRFVEFPLLLDLAPFCSMLCLDLPHVASNQNQILYSLYGIVEHTGRLASGHYAAYVKVSSKASNTLFLNHWPSSQCKLNHQLEELSSLFQVQKISEKQQCIHEVSHSPEKWFYISDSRVREVSEEQVLNCQAYLLFYQRIL